MTNEQLQYLNDTIYTPIWREKTAQYTGIRFSNAEEDVYVRGLVDQFRNADKLRKQARFEQQTARQQNAKTALYWNMNKLAAYANGQAAPAEQQGYEELYRMVQDPKLAAALDELNI